MSDYEDRLDAAASITLTLQSRKATAVAAASAPPAGSTPVQLTNEAQSRQIADLRAIRSIRALVELAGTVNAAARVGLQLHAGGDPTVASGDAGWVTLAMSSGGHTSGTPFFTAEFVIPRALQGRVVTMRPVFIDGNGAAVPQLARMDAILFA